MHGGVGEKRVDDGAGVLDHAVAKDGHPTGIRIDLHYAGGQTVGPGRVDREAAVPFGLVVDVGDPEVAGGFETRFDQVGMLLEGMPVDPLGDIREADGTLRIGFHPDPSIRGGEHVRLAAQHGGRHRVHAQPQLAACLEHGRATDDDAPRAVVPQTPGAGLGVSLHHGDPLDLASQRAGRYLGESGLVAVAG